MKNKVVFVTGSSRGIGLAIAEKLHTEGAQVFINCSKSADEMRAIEKRLGVKGFLGDVSDYGVCKKIIEQIGHVDILINNAGISHFGLFTETTPEEWERLIRVNEFSVYNCCRLALPSMINKKEGKIINVSSVWGLAGASCEAMYSATKGAVNTFTKALAKEVAPSNIIVNAIACGVIDTSMNDRLDEEEMKELMQSIGLMKFGRPEDVAELCLYLAKTEYMTGQILCLDGGFL